MFCVKKCHLNVFAVFALFKVVVEVVAKGRAKEVTAVLPPETMAIRRVKEREELKVVAGLPAVGGRHTRRVDWDTEELVILISAEEEVVGTTEGAVLDKAKQHLQEAAGAAITAVEVYPVIPGVVGLDLQRTVILT